jgi:hypothetical protein
MNAFWILFQPSVYTNRLLYHNRQNICKNSVNKTQRCQTQWLPNVNNINCRHHTYNKKYRGHGLDAINNSQSCNSALKPFLAYNLWGKYWLCAFKKNKTRRVLWPDCLNKRQSVVRPCLLFFLLAPVSFPSQLKLTGPGMQSADKGPRLFSQLFLIRSVSAVTARRVKVL